MIAIDTNVLVRLFVNDDTDQTNKVRALFDSYADEDQSLWVTDIVLIELVWVLKRSYDCSVSEICSALRALANSASVCIKSNDFMFQAVALYEQGPAGFADCLLAVKAGHAGCVALRTFDKKMKTLPGVKLL